MKYIGKFLMLFLATVGAVAAYGLVIDVAKSYKKHLKDEDRRERLANFRAQRIAAGKVTS